jgi:hypothetical protein
LYYVDWLAEALIPSDVETEQREGPENIEPHMGLRKVFSDKHYQDHWRIEANPENDWIILHPKIKHTHTIVCLHGRDTKPF